MKRISLLVITIVAFGFFAAQVLGQQDIQVEKDKEWRSSQVKGMTVQSQEGQELGKVEDVVFDKQGEISYLVISRQDDQLVPIPWNAASPEKEQDKLIIGMSQDEIQQAPSFASNQWPEFDQNYEQEVLSYFGQEPKQPGQQQDQMMQQEDQMEQQMDQQY